MAILLICLNVFLIFVTRILTFVSKFFIDGTCVVALAHVARTMSGATFQALLVMIFTNGSIELTIKFTKNWVKTPKFEGISYICRFQNNHQ